MNAGERTSWAPPPRGNLDPSVPWGEFGEREGGWGAVARRVVAALLAVVLALWLGMLANAQATSDEVALPALERAVASLTEVDALIALHAEEIDAAAAEGGELALPGFPIDVRVEAEAVLDADGEVDGALLRAELLAAAAARARDEGIAAFHDPEGAAVDTTTRSSAGQMRRLIDELRESRHDRWVGLTLPLLVVAAVLVAALLWLGRGASRLAALGTAVLVAGALVVLGTVAMRLGMGLMGGDDPVGEEARAIAGDLLGAHLRDGLIAGVAGVALLVPVFALRWLEDRA